MGASLNWATVISLFLPKPLVLVTLNPAFFKALRMNPAAVYVDRVAFFVEACVKVVKSFCGHMSGLIEGEKPSRNHASALMCGSCWICSRACCMSARMRVRVMFDFLKWRVCVVGRSAGYWFCRRFVHVLSVGHWLCIFLRSLSWMGNFSIEM